MTERSGVGKGKRGEEKLCSCREASLTMWGPWG